MKMVLELICSDEVEGNGERIDRSPEANRISAHSERLLQYKANPGKTRSMSTIPPNTVYFDVSIQIIGGLTRYRIKAKNSEGNTLNTFYYLV
jgi:hypothetical protein